MAFTGDLEQLHIIDIIQLIHTTRKSGTFVVRGVKGESRIIFSNGYIVSASHLNNSIRIGTVLVKTDVLSLEDLKQSLDALKNAGTARKPLLAMLIDLGKISREEALTGLRKLIEITVVELIGWTKGTFTFDTEAIEVSPHCTYRPGSMEQEIGLDAQMVLMDALRIYDERERDRSAGKEVPSYEEIFAEVVPVGLAKESGKRSQILTAEDLGLDDIEHLEKKIPHAFSVKELFDPHEIQRGKIRELLPDLPAEEQGVLLSFLQKSASRATYQRGSARPEGQTSAVILFSDDEFMIHAVMTLFKNEGGIVFATGKKDEIDQITSQCLSKKILPVVVYDCPRISERELSEGNTVITRQTMRGRYPGIPHIQIAPAGDYSFTVKSYHEGIGTVIPKPAWETGRKGFIEDTIQFLKAFQSCINFHVQRDLPPADASMNRLRERLMVLRSLNEPPDISLALLQAVSETFERSITFFIRQSEMIGERSIGLRPAERREAVSASKLKIPLTGHSVFSQVVEKGLFFYGESDDTMLTRLFEEIGVPRRPTILLLPMKSRQKVLTVTYGDFGGKEISQVPLVLLEIMALEAGLVLDNTLYRRQAAKDLQK